MFLWKCINLLGCRYIVPLIFTNIFLFSRIEILTSVFKIKAERGKMRKNAFKIWKTIIRIMVWIHITVHYSKINNIFVDHQNQNVLGFNDLFLDHFRILGMHLPEMETKSPLHFYCHEILSPLHLSFRNCCHCWRSSVLGSEPGWMLWIETPFHCEVSV